MTSRDALAAVFAVLLWGLNVAITKVGVMEMPPMFLLGLRFALVAAMAVWFVPVPFHRMKAIIQLAVVLGFIHFALNFTGLRLIDASTMAVAQQVQVPFSALLGAVLYKEKLSLRRIIGMALAFLGVIVLAGDPKILAAPLGLILVILASIVWTVASIQMKGLSDISGTAVNAWMALYAAPMLILGSFVFEDGQMEALHRADTMALVSIVYMAIAVTLIGYGIWFRLLRKYPVSSVMPFTLLIPVFGILSGVIFLGDELTVPTVLGAVVTMAGVAAIVLEKRKPTAPVTEAKTA